MFFMLCVAIAIKQSQSVSVIPNQKIQNSPELQEGNQPTPGLPFQLPLDSANISAERSARIQNLIHLKESDKGDCYQRDDRFFRFYCPSAVIQPGGSYSYVCISKEQLCDHIPDCPAAEDEDLLSCMFYESKGAFSCSTKCTTYISSSPTITRKVIITEEFEGPDSDDFLSLV